MPTSLESPPILLYHNNNDSSRTSDGDRPTPASVLRAASPQLPPEKQWLVYRHMGKGTRGAGSSAVQHAKLTLLRFGPGEGDGHGFLRVVLGSANLYQQWEHSRGKLSVCLKTRDAMIGDSANAARFTHSLARPLTPPEHQHRRAVGARFPGHRRPAEPPAPASGAQQRPRAAAAHPKLLLPRPLQGGKSRL